MNRRHPLDYFEAQMADDPNYDGQGKSRAQETRDSTMMLRVVLVIVLLSVVVMGWVIWEVGR